MDGLGHRANRFFNGRGGIGVVRVPETMTSADRRLRLELSALRT
jgi:hypothetical protein